MVNIEPIDSKTLVDMNLPRNIFSLDEPTQELTDEMTTLIKFMKKHLVFRGGNTELVEEIKNEFPELSTTPQKLKQQMVKFCYLLEEQGVPDGTVRRIWQS